MILEKGTGLCQSLVGRLGGHWIIRVEGSEARCLEIINDLVVQLRVVER
jgi:hypothetical protein